MAIILNLDTATGTASLCLAKEGTPLRLALNDNQKDHAAWLHPAIQKLLTDSGMTANDLDAVAVTIGPGSYTGLRVGLSTAKGLCFALNIPLIGVNTLEMMAHAVKEEDAELFCPLIDARRMEVFMAVYDKKMSEIIKPAALIIEPDSFDNLFASGKVLFTGDGVNKVQKVVTHPNAFFNNTIANASHLSEISAGKYLGKKFSDLAYTEPLYIKEFYSPVR